MLSFIGILHESNHYIRGLKPVLLTIIPALIFHIVVVGAMVLIILGYQSNQNQGPALQKIGYILFVTIFLAVALLTGLSWRITNRGNGPHKLLIAIAIALPFLGVRVFYSLVSAFDHDINAYTGPITYRVCLAILMEFVMVVVFAVFGVMSRNLRAEEQVYSTTGENASDHDVELVPEGGNRKRWLQARRV
ncbi:hypothetical protein BP5796_08841 [Coleophoma crateriformis]|uniref:DUF7702 domain-containing protein n=1 Tax=Coleophoma crateriformis TaxID=565419 RepID=A0A3D8R9A6_9HELO|nr:hypothetical protein BP5796_08841 [Coleophoma crateriformis]